MAVFSLGSEVSRGRLCACVICMIGGLQQWGGSQGPREGRDRGADGTRHLRGLPRRHLMQPRWVPGPLSSGKRPSGSLTYVSRGPCEAARCR